QLDMFLAKRLHGLEPLKESLPGPHRLQALR
ncbi:MAG: hypothetical protein JWM18_2605, partial [Chloroflexi bacterium]|nr:hypothetical protein [Chloroflexota bacterium]